MDHSVRIAAAIYPYLSRNSSFPDCRLIRGAVWAAKHRFAALACANPAPIFDAFGANLRQLSIAAFCANSAPICANFLWRQF
jgi:hypothetical protein